MVLNVGDRVLVRRLAFQGRHKLADRWEEAPYTVQRQLNPDIPVYVLKREDGRGRERTLHRNHLLPIGSIPIPVEDDVIEAPKMVRPKRTEPVTQHSDNDKDKEGSVDDEDSGDELEGCAIVPCVSEGAEPAEASEESSHTETVDSDIENEVFTSSTGGSVGSTSESGITESIGEGDGEAEPAADEGNGEESTDELASGEDEVGESGDSDATESVDEASGSAEEPEGIDQGAVGGDEPEDALRRSKRVKKPPDRYTDNTGLSKRSQIPEWTEKANYLASLASQPAFSAMQEGLCKAIVQVVVGD